MAFFMTAHCPPPHAHLTSPRPVSPSTALSQIETFLSNTAEHPHLHPDCRFNEAGPTLEGRPVGGSIALHQLGRIVRGLKGERLVPEVDGQNEAGSEAIDNEDDSTDMAAVASQTDLMPAGDDRKLDQLIAQSAKQSINDTDGAAGTDEDPASPADSLESGIVEKSYNEQMLEQGEDGVIEGEIGPRNSGIRDGAVIPQVNVLGSKKDKKVKKRKIDEAAANEESQDGHRKKARKEKHMDAERQNGKPMLTNGKAMVNGTGAHETDQSVQASTGASPGGLHTSQSTKKKSKNKEKHSSNGVSNGHSSELVQDPQKLDKKKKKKHKRRDNNNE